MTRYDLDSPEWDQAFEEITTSWFRLETLQQYDVSGEREELEAFQSGATPPARDHEPTPWQAMIQRHVKAGLRLQRVHIVTEPLTHYIQRQIAWGYPRNHEYGEDIRILACPSGTWPANLPRDYDFWLLDDVVWAMTYDPVGKPLYVDRLTDADTVARHQSWRAAALADAIPVTDYINSNEYLRARTYSPSVSDRTRAPARATGGSEPGR
ncbi:MAG: hypothetical protein J2P23_04105 [Microlunatus sp.]|nr:hypothetical protein [Microlunatus sp.]